MQQSSPTTPAKGLQALLLAWLLLAGVTLWLAVGMVGKPFPGFLIVSNGVTGGVLLSHWPGAQAGVKSFERVVAFEGRPDVSARAIYDEVARKPAGTAFTYATVPAGATTPITRTVASATFDWRDFNATFFIWWLTGALHLVIGAVVLGLRPGQGAARDHWLLCQALAAFYLLNFEPAGTHYTPSWLVMLVLAFWIPAFARLALGFPRPLASERARTVLLGGSLAVAVGLSAWVVLASRDAVLWAQSVPVFLGLPTLAVVAAMACWGWQAVSRQTPAPARRQAQIITLGIAGAYVPMIVTAFLPLADGRLGGVTLAAQCTFSLFPLAIAYAIVRQDLFEVGLLFRRIVLYGLTLATLGALYAGVTYAGYRLVPHGDVTAFLAAFVVVSACRPVYQQLKRRIDDWFLGPRADALRTFASFSDGLPADAEAIARLMLDRVEAGLRPRGVALATATSWSRGEVPGEECLIVPLRTSERVVGELRLGPKLNGLGYDPEERALLSVMAAHAAIAFENVRLFDERLTARLDEATARADAEARGDVVRQIVHDIRTDLFNISLAAEVARERPQHDRAWEAIDRSLTRIDRFLSEKLRGLLPEGVERRCELSAGVQSAADAVAGSVSGKSQALTLELPEGPAWVPLSPVELVQVVVNLFDNALKFSPPGSRVRCRVSLEESSVALIEVSDEGPGLPLGLLADPFCGHRGDPRVPGTGLGLRNVKVLVEGVGGDVSVRNGERGALVQIRLPQGDEASLPGRR